MMRAPTSTLTWLAGSKQTFDREQRMNVRNESIRLAILDDAPAIVDLQLQLGQHHVELEPDNPRYQVEEDHWATLIETAIRSRRSRFLVATLDDEVRGFVRVTFVDKPWGIGAEMDTLVVGEGFRDRGIGERLVAAAEDLARRGGARGVRANVLSGNTRGQDFYRRMGYTEIAVRFGKALT